MLIEALAVLSLISQTQPAAAPAKSGEKNAKQMTHAPTDPKIGAWLVELARHQGHLLGRTDPRAAALHVLALLKAAVETSPDCADAHYWLYDIETRLGRVADARKALAEYVRLSPADESARLRLFELQIEDRQTAEDRFAFVEAELDKPGLSRIYESELHGWMAQYHFERRENGKASREIEHALRLNPMNIGARQIAYQMFSETEPSLQRVEMALQLISANPSQTNVVWGLGEYLDRLSMHKQAQEWYTRAIQLHRQANAGPVPADHWHRLAVSYLNSGEFDKSREAAEAAIAADPSQTVSRLLLASVLKKLNKSEDATAEIKRVETVFNEQFESVLTSKDFNRAAEIAWFFAFHQLDKQKSLDAATVAMEDPEPSILAQLAYGYALRLNGRSDDAEKVLKPIAGIDQLAAYELGRIQLEDGRKGVAMTTLHKGATIQYTGIAADLINDLLRQQGDTPPVVPQYTRIAEALERFKRDVFDYFKRPGDFLRVTMRFARDPMAATGAIDVIFRMENTGPFPITFGEGFMARPLIAISATIDGKTDAANENYIQVLMNSRPTLLPGDAVEKMLAIDIGFVRKTLMRRAAEPVQIKLSAMFDPVILEGALAAGPGTIEIPAITATRPGVDASRKGIDTLIALSRSPVMEDRIIAAEEIGSMLSAIGAATNDSPLAKTPVDELHASLAKLLNDESWQVRSHAVVAAGWSTLDPQVTTNAASSRVRNDNAIERMLAIRLFAEQHGEKFRGVLESMSKTDDVDFVRMMAASYLPEAVQANSSR